MIIPKRAFGSLAFLCLTLTTTFAATELLYVQEGPNILTYSVNNTTAVATKLGTLKTNYNPSPEGDPTLGITIQRSGSFLYVLGRSHSLEYFTVYHLTGAGVPMAKSVQTLSIKPQVKQGQFYIHPSGKFAYVTFSWTQTVKGDFDYASDIVLFTIDPKTGKLTNTKKVLANFPLSVSERTAIFSVNGEGTKLYTKDIPVPNPDQSPSIDKYFYYTFNTTTGTLVKAKWSWTDTNEDTQFQSSVFSDALIAQWENSDGDLEINVYPNKAGVNPNAPLIQCTSKMLVACGDNTYGPWLDPSGKYLFFGDVTIKEMQIVHINTAIKKLQASGASIPGNPDALAFSPDGLLVYAIEKSEILVYVFHSGKFTAKSTIKAPGLIQIVPVK